MNLSDTHLAILAALRGASVLRREPGVLTPDGHEHWWTLGDLAAEDRFDFGPPDLALAPLSSAARGLCKQHLVASKTLFTIVRYRITEEGLLFLAAWEAAHGTAGQAAARMDLEQAYEDLHQAQGRIRAAEARLAALARERSGR